MLKKYFANNLITLTCENTKVKLIKALFMWFNHILHFGPISISNNNLFSKSLWQFLDYNPSSFRQILVNFPKNFHHVEHFLDAFLEFLHLFRTAFFFWLPKFWEYHWRTDSWSRKGPFRCCKCWDIYFWNFQSWSFKFWKFRNEAIRRC